VPRDRVLVVDDEEGVRFAVRDFLSARGYDVDEADSLAGAVQTAGDECPDVAILDYQLPDGDALELLGRLRRGLPELPVVILTAHGSIDLAVRAMKEGADHFLTKPVELKALLVVVERLVEAQRLRKKQLAARAAGAPVDPFAGESAAICRLAEEAGRVAPSDSSVLVLGETGAGKGVLAAWLHAAGPRAKEPFVDLNCAGFSKELLESELFGHEKGAFTGAVAAKPGLMEVAHKGTLFLDEVGDMDLEVQPKLLKAVEERRFRRLGEVRDRRVDVRLIAATQRDLSALVRDGKFRSDLYYRLGAIPLRVPSLRERREDVVPLARRFVEQAAADLKRPGVRLSAEAESALRGYDWPGNVRELRNVLERAVLLSHGGALRPADLRFEAGPAPAASGEADLAMSLDDVERAHIERVLAAEGGRVDAAARRLGLSRSSLYARLRRHGIPPPRR
jgi:DNA-binding NtrC family response regulator